jgi:hypothetical protein
VTLAQSKHLQPNTHVALFNPLLPPSLLALPPPPPHVTQWARTLVLVVCLGWASWATVPFIGKTVSQE